MLSLKNDKMSEVLKSHTILYIGFILLIFFFVLGISSRNKIYRDNKSRVSVHKIMLKDASWDYISSILWIEYNNKQKENDVISSSIIDNIHNAYESDTLGFKNDFDNAIVGKCSKISSIVRNITKRYDDKIVLYRKGSELYIMDDVSRDYSISLYKLPKWEFKGEKSDIAKDLLSNNTYNINDFTNHIYNSDGVQHKLLNTDEIQDKFLDGKYDFNNLNGVLISATYVNWKKGLFGDNIHLEDGKTNPDIRQLIIVSKINITGTISKYPTVIKHIDNFSRNAREVDKTFSENDRHNIIVMAGSVLMFLFVTLIILINKDLEDHRREDEKNSKAQ